MGLKKQELAYSPALFTAQGAGEAEQHDTGLLLPANRAWFNGFQQKGKEERREDAEALNQMLQLFPCFPSKGLRNLDGIN